jgi:GT2 family glycosyltransferase/glycosyltransferase involved in cell wall biosynthesis
MSGHHEELAARLQAQLERRRRLAEELARLSEDAREMSDGNGALPRWQRTAPAGGPASIGRPPGVRPAPVTVAVPIHNALGAVHSCLDSLVRHTTYPASLLLIDDASTEAGIDALLEMAAQLEGCRVLRNVVNMGFTASVNRALRACEGDVVLLNSDTEVGPRWLEQLVLSAYSSPDIGTVTPVSDNAGAFAVPEPNQPNVLPSGLSVTDVARLFSLDGSRELVETPTAGGFCMYIKRAVIEAVGEFDAESFPRGYGEENDFCMRAARLGWRHVVDGRTFVHHERESSFGAEKKELLAAGRARVDELHPDYTERARAFVSGSAMADVRESARRLLADAIPGIRPRVLFVIHEGGGGAIATNWDLMGALSAEFDCWVFSSDRWVLRCGRFRGGELEPLKEWPLEQAILLMDFSRRDYRAAFAEALELARPELVHVRHVFKHTLDAPKMAADRAIPVVMSIHDYYTVCPTIQLVDNNGRFCGGPCTPGHGVCPTLPKAGPVPTLKHGFVYQWREEMESALRRVDAFVTTSEPARAIHQQMHPAVREKRFELIEHGRDLEQASGLCEAPVPGGKVRILITGNFDRHKGGGLVAAMRELDTDERLELHFLGDVRPQYRHLGVMHGTYARETFLERVAEIRPAFIGIFSVWGETYSHVLTEAWAAGVPAIVTDIGAPAERVRRHGGGFVVPLEDAQAALNGVLAAADDPDAYERERALATLHDIPSVAEMSERYAELYRDVLDSCRTIVLPAGRSSTALAASSS